MTGFCETCRDTVSFTIKEESKVKSIRGKDITYIAKIAYCNECKNEIFISELRDHNVKALDKAFREHEKLISVAEIESVLKKYRIGKRPLSLLLNWGEGTLTRYLDGDIPTKQYSDTLKRVLADPEYMMELLEANKENVNGQAYRQCKEAINRLKVEWSKGNDKIDSVVKYIIFRCVEITPLALQKLLYYAQGFFKAFNSRYLFDNDCEAWIHGPVFKSIYNKYKDHGFNPIDENSSQYDDFELTDVETEILDSIIMNFGCYSGKVLEKMTHIETPWREARIGLGDDEGSSRIIKKEAISEYFLGIKKKYDMLNYSDIKDYSVDLFRKIYN